MNHLHPLPGGPSSGARARAPSPTPAGTLPLPGPSVTPLPRRPLAPAFPTSRGYSPLPPPALPQPLPPCPLPSPSPTSRFTGPRLLSSPHTPISPSSGLQPPFPKRVQPPPQVPLTPRLTSLSQTRPPKPPHLLAHAHNAHRDAMPRQALRQTHPSPPPPNTPRPSRLSRPTPPPYRPHPELHFPGSIAARDISHWPLAAATLARPSPNGSNSAGTTLPKVH